MTAAGDRRRQLFLDAVDLADAERESFLRDHCDDPVLRAEVLELLALEPPDTFLVPPDLATDAYVGKVFGPYVVDGSAAAGPGRHLARHAMRGHRAEIEVLPLAADGADDRITAFVRAAHRIGLLRQPAHVPVHEHGRLANAFWFARDRVAGHDLATELERQRSPDQSDGAPLLPPTGSRAWLQAVLGLFATVGELLEAAHRIGIAHGDLTPTRVLVDDRGHGFVTGFGVTALLGRPASPTLDTAALAALLHDMLVDGLAQAQEPPDGHLHVVPARERAAALALLARLSRTSPRKYADVTALLADVRRVRDGQPPDAVRWTHRLRSWLAGEPRTDGAGTQRP